MKYFKKMTGTKCYLSPVNVDDYEKFTEWVNDIELCKNLSFLHTVISINSEKEALERLSKSNSNFTIVDISNNEPIGACGLMCLDHINKTADFGIFIGNKEYWNKGYGEEATNLTLDFGFNILNLSNIMLRVYSFNPRAHKCYLKCGFKEIGTRRQAHLVAGTAHDVIFMDIISSDFKKSTVKKAFQ